MTYPLKSKRKRFDPTLYKVSDKLAKDSLTKYLVALGHDVNEHKERMGVDLESSLAAGAVRIPYLHEVEIKFLWEDEWPEAWKDINIPFRKKRLIDKVYSENDKARFSFYILRGDCKVAWKIDGQVVKGSPVVEVPNRQVRSGEYFYKVPLDKAELITLEEKDNGETKDI